ncbi:MAG: GTPase HflX [Gammaproteobacteria bacterium]|nr:GTPase HflX [Gammaproteobacteria bacterium]
MLFERPQSGERAVLVHVHESGQAGTEELAEFRELVAAADVEVLDVLDAPQRQPQPRYLIGSGKVDELAAAVKAIQADVVIFNQSLSPAQVRNLEQLCKTRVIDRIDLILDIFAQRARSFEGKLQVELAQLEHLATRLVRGWTHLERQRGGIGLRGPGETQLETDRRLIGRRIRQINDKLAKVRRHRQDSSRARRRANLSIVSLVGYTNAGKSTLFNRLTNAGVFAADQLFATLDTTLRRLELPGENPVLLSDTVGFIRDLPHELIEAFQATLEETREATLLLHVIDAAAEERDLRIAEVETVLEAIGAASIPVVRVYNKIDCQPDTAARMERGADGLPSAVWVSAVTGEGMDLLRDAVAEHINQAKLQCWVSLPASAGRLRARLFEIGAVLDEAVTADGWLVEVALDAGRAAALWQSAGLAPPEMHFGPLPDPLPMESTDA